MASGGRYTALLDACVLYSAPLRDILLSLAHADLYQARWSQTILQEWTSNLLANRQDLDVARLERTCVLMTEAIPDCLIENYEALIAGLKLPDPNDRHVLAAAIVGHADAIITFNLKDFPEEILASYHIEPVHPDDFIANQLELRQLEALAAIQAMRRRLRYPPQSAEQLIATLERAQLPQTAAQLREAAALI